MADAKLAQEAKAAAEAAEAKAKADAVIAAKLKRESGEPLANGWVLYRF